jgi:hypothetical protein
LDLIITPVPTIFCPPGGSDSILCAAGIDVGEDYCNDIATAGLCCDGTGTNCPQSMLCPGCPPACGPYSGICCYTDGTVYTYPICCVRCS